MIIFKDKCMQFKALTYKLFFKITQLIQLYRHSLFYFDSCFTTLINNIYLQTYFNFIIFFVCFQNSKKKKYENKRRLICKMIDCCIYDEVQKHIYVLALPTTTTTTKIYIFENNKKNFKKWSTIITNTLPVIHALIMVQTILGAKA